MGKMTNGGGLRKLFSWRKKAAPEEPLCVAPVEETHRRATTDMPRSALKPRPVTDYELNGNTNVTRTPSPYQSQKRQASIEAWIRASPNLSAEGPLDQSRLSISSTRSGQSEAASGRPYTRRQSSRPARPLPGKTSPIMPGFGTSRSWAGGLDYPESQMPPRVEAACPEGETVPTTPPMQSSVQRSPASPCRPSIEKNAVLVASEEGFWHDAEESNVEDLTQVPSPPSIKRDRRRSSLMRARYSATPSQHSLDLLQGSLQGTPEVDNVPMFNFIPATPVAGSDDFGHRRKSSSISAVQVILEEPVEIADKQVEPKAGEEEDAESRDVVPEMPHIPQYTNHRSKGSYSSMSSGQTHSSESSMRSMPSLSSSASLASSAELDDALGAMLATIRSDKQALPIDPMSAEKARVDEELASWAALSLAARNPSQNSPARKLDFGEGIGLGFGTGWEAPTSQLVQRPSSTEPLQARRRDGHRDTPRSDSDKTPTVRQYSPVTPLTPHASKAESEDAWTAPTHHVPPHRGTGHVRQTSIASSTSSSDVHGDTDSDSIFSDMEDLQTVSISRVQHPTDSALMYASPITLHLGEKTPDQTETLISNDDHRHIGWAM